MEDSGLENPLTLDDFQIERVIVDTDVVANFRSERDFTALAVELFKEIGSLTGIVACTYGLDELNRPRKWTRNEAIHGGLMVRLTKLQIGLLDAICKDRLEISSILWRCLAETVVNVKYLLGAKSGALHDQYVEYSLREEKRLLKLINKNVTESGNELPIERRMKRSIMRAFEISGLPPEAVDESKRNPWGGSVFSRARHLGLDGAYLGLFSQPSHAVHGNWQDLVNCHLTVSGDGFLPNPDWKESRPQIVLAAVILSSDASLTYLESLPACEDRDNISQRIQDCLQRSRKVEELHETFLQPEDEAQDGWGTD